MAERSTLARPYAQALFESAEAAGGVTAWVELVDELATLVAHPRVAEVVGDPNLDAAQVEQLLTGMLAKPPTPMAVNFLHTLIDNDRLAALPEIARQLRELKNASEGVADCLIETAFPLSAQEQADLVAALARKFGLRLQATVRVDPELIGGVRVLVGDHVLDTTIKTRLAQMQAALLAA